MNNLRQLSLVSFFLLLCLSFSCIKVSNFAADDWEASFAVPILQTTVVMEDFLVSLEEEGGIEIDSDNAITLAYSDKIFSESAANFFSIPPSFSFPLLDTAIAINPNDFGLDEFPPTTFLKTGNLQIQFASNETYSVNVELQIDNLTQNGQPFVFNFTIPFDGAPPSEFMTTLDISGYILDLSIPLTIKYFAFDNMGERLWLFNDFPNLNFLNLDFQYAEGHFPGIAFDVPIDSFDFDFFVDSFEGDIELTKPKLSFRFRNSVGIPVAIQSEKIQAMTQKSGRFDFVSPLDDGYIMKYPTQMGQNVLDTFSFTIENSNIDDVLNALPTRFIYDLEGFGFPPGTEDVTGFIQDTSSFDVFVDMELPLEGSVMNLKYETITDVEENNLDGAKEIEFKLLTVNDFPLEAGLQVFFLDEEGNELDKLFPTQGIIPPATRVNLAGRAVTPGEGELIITLNETQLENISNMRQIRLVTNLNTSNDNTLVEPKIFSDYGLDIRLGMKVTFEN